MEGDIGLQSQVLSIVFPVNCYFPGGFLQVFRTNSVFMELNDFHEQVAMGSGLWGHQLRKQCLQMGAWSQADTASTDSDWHLPMHTQYIK